MVNCLSLSSTLPDHWSRGIWRGMRPRPTGLSARVLFLSDLFAACFKIKLDPHPTSEIYVRTSINIVDFVCPTSELQNNMRCFINGSAEEMQSNVLWRQSPAVLTEGRLFMTAAP